MTDSGSVNRPALDGGDSDDARGSRRCDCCNSDYTCGTRRCDGDSGVSCDGDSPAALKCCRAQYSNRGQAHTESAHRGSYSNHLPFTPTRVLASSSQVLTCTSQHPEAPGFGRMHSLAAVAAVGQVPQVAASVTRGIRCHTQECDAESLPMPHESQLSSAGRVTFRVAVTLTSATCVIRTTHDSGSV
jgi:hypothetical protein